MDVMNSFYQQHPVMGAPVGAYGGYYGGGYGYTQPYNYDINNYGSFQPMVYNNGISQVPIPTESTLTDDEAKILNAACKPDVMSLKVSQEDLCRGVCNHKGKFPDGRPVRVLEINDGSGDVQCEQCGHRWNPNRTYDEVVESTKVVDDAINTIKIINPMPISLARQYYSILPILQMTPDIYKYTMNRFNNGFNQQYLINQDDMRAMSEMAAVMPTEVYGVYDRINNGYINPYQNQYMQMQALQQQGIAQPNVNPMQATYGINPAAPNQQFVQQAQAMMPGQPYQMAQSAYNYGAPQVQQPIPVSNPYFAPAGQQQQQGAAVTDNKDGSETSSQVISL